MRSIGYVSFRKFPVIFLPIFLLVLRDLRPILCVASWLKAPVITNEQSSIISLILYKPKQEYVNYKKLQVFQVESSLLPLAFNLALGLVFLPVRSPPSGYKNDLLMSELAARMLCNSPLSLSVSEVSAFIWYFASNRIWWYSL